MRRFISFVVLALFILGLVPVTTLAQPPGKPGNPSPTPAAEGPVPAMPSQAPAGGPGTTAPRLDLAAMALDSTVVPDGYVLFYELYLPGSRIGSDLTGGLISQDEIDATGLQWYYESVYTSADGSVRLRSYIEQYANEQGAISGFDLLEDENRLAPAGAVFHDEPGAGVGEQPSEISEGSLQPSGSPMLITSVDSTFRTGNLLAGVSVDTVPGIAADKQLAVDLTKVLFDRIQSVRANQPLALIDYTLPTQVVTLGSGWASHDEGYLAAPEIFGPDAGASVASSFVSGYFTNESPANSTAAFPVPLVSLTVAKFQDEATPLQLINQSGTLAPPFDGASPLDISPIPGSTITRAFQYINPLLSSGASLPDSVRIVMLTGNELVTLDIQANNTLDGARDAAIRIATAQVACLQSTAACAPLQLPEGLLAPPAQVTAPANTPAPVG